MGQPSGLPQVISICDQSGCSLADPRLTRSQQVMSSHCAELGLSTMGGGCRGLSQGGCCESDGCDAGPLGGWIGCPSVAPDCMGASQLPVLEVGLLAHPAPCRLATAGVACCRCAEAAALGSVCQAIMRGSCLQHTARCTLCRALKASTSPLARTLTARALTAARNHNFSCGISACQIHWFDRRPNLCTFDWCLSTRPALRLQR